MQIQELKNFSNATVLVIGDIMIDRFWWGNVSRISPEAPVPVVKFDKESFVPGGAANVAANVSGLGAKSILIGVTGEDKESELLPQIISNAQISENNILRVPGRQTTIKTRIIAQGQQIVRLDNENNEHITTEIEDELLDRVDNYWERVDVLVLSDYAKGLLTDNFISRLITKARLSNKIVVVDPKGKNFSKYENANIITPNRSEIIEAYNIGNYNRYDFTFLRDNVISKLNLDALLVTEGEEGMSLYEKAGLTEHLDSLARDVYDVTGAGDTVVACLATSIACKKSFLDSAKFANTAAGLVVEHRGTTAINLDMLTNNLS